MERIRKLVFLSPMHLCHCPLQSIKKIGILTQEEFPYLFFDLVWRNKSKTFSMQAILPWCIWTVVRGRKKCVISLVNKKNRIEDQSKRILRCFVSWLAYKRVGMIVFILIRHYLAYWAEIHPSCQKMALLKCCIILKLP